MPPLFAKGFGVGAFPRGCFFHDILGIAEGGDALLLSLSLLVCLLCFKTNELDALLPLNLQVVTVGELHHSSLWEIMLVKLVCLIIVLSLQV